MKIDISNAINNEGNIFNFEFEQDWNDIDFNGDILRFASPLKVKGNYMFAEGNVAVKGTIAVKIHANCYRCLRPFVYLLESDFDEEYSKDPDSEHPDNYLYSGDEVDLDEMINENVILHIPMKNVCSENCKGLCPICGANLNEKTCSCNKEIFDNRPLSSLKDVIAMRNKEV